VTAIQPDLLRADDFPVTFGRYTLMGLLGEGGMARVFRAELQGPAGFRKAAAVKIIRASVATRSEALRASLKNEARLGGLLHHPNIVDTYDYGEVEGLPYIAMEMVRGLGLDVILNAVRPLPAPLAVEFGAQICAGLDHAHNLEDAGVDSQLVHRDLKPSNVIVSRDGLVKVMDFGIAKATMISEGNTQTGMTKGTPAYMSPEQVGGEDLDPRSDLFAMGAILYELVTGERLFGGDSIMSVLMSVIRVEERMADPAIIASVEERAPGMAAIIVRCLKKEREDRFDDAADLENALRLVARELPPPPSLKKWVRALMNQQGVAGAEPSAASLPLNSPAPPTPAHTPRAPAPMSGAAAAMPATVQVAAPAPRPIPPSPPETPPEVAGPTRAQIASMDQVAARGPVPRKRKRKQGGSPLVLLLLGLLVGSAAAIVAVLAWTAISGTAQDDPPAVVDDLPAPAPVKRAVEPPKTADAPPKTASKRPTRAADVARTRPVAPAPAKTPVPAAAAESTPEPLDEATPEATAAEEPAVPDPAELARREEERQAALAEKQAREEARKERREKAAREKAAREKAVREKAAADAAVPDPNAPRKPRAETKDSGDRLRVSSARVSSTENEDGSIKVRFSAAVSGSDIDGVTVYFNPRGASWVSRSMRSRDGKSYTVNVTFKERNSGVFYYYVEAVDSVGKKAYSGTESRPLKATAE
jgi:eukaryotic-like serine/threonine-protein kinase